MRFRQDPDTGELVLVHARSHENVAAYVQRDIAPFKSPIDGSVIGTHHQLREHNKRHGVQQLGAYGDAEGQAYFERARRERDDRLTGNTKQDRAERLAAIIPIVTQHDR